MEREIFMALCGALSFAMIGGFGLVGLRMWLNVRSQRGGEIERGDLERLSDAVEGVHAQLHQLQDAVTELHERVDFAERLLTRGDAMRPEHQDTPV